MHYSPKSNSDKASDFMKTYKFLCEQNDTGPLKRVMRYPQGRIVDINIDNIRYILLLIPKNIKITDARS